MKILFSTDYGMGIGDFIIKLYAICHLNKYIKEKFDFYTIFIIEEYQTNILNELLNINFFNQYFNKFMIQKNPGQYAQNIPYNDIVFNNENYSKQYSAINNYLQNNGRGYWECYTNNKTILPIDYMHFDYRDPSSRKSEPIPDYNLNIFHPNIYKKAELFVKNTINNNFDCVYYRYLHQIDNKHLQLSINKIKDNIKKNKKIFLTSNSEIIKEYFIKNLSDNNCFTYKKIDTTLMDGIGIASADSERVLDLAVEMIIMSYSDKIHYAGNHHYISLFNYYAHMIKNIPLEEYHV